MMIGVGKGEPLPALRTVRAVLPHTALQSVVSSSGLARQNVGFMHGEKSPFSEESIWPLSMITISSARTWPLFLLFAEQLLDAGV